VSGIAASTSARDPGLKRSRMTAKFASGRPDLNRGPPAPKVGNPAAGSVRISSDFLGPGASFWITAIAVFCRGFRPQNRSYISREPRHPPATIFVACTSRQTRDLAFAMAGSSNMRLWVAARVAPRGTTFPPQTLRRNRPVSTAQAGRRSIHIA
jgi:hypothetical protein